MTKLNTAVLNVVAEALSNDRYPKNGVGYTISAADKRKIKDTIRAEMAVGPADDAAIVESLAVIARQYSAAPASRQADWAKHNKKELDALIAGVPVLRAQIGGAAGGGLEKARELEKNLGKLAGAIGLDVREDGPDTELIRRSLPDFGRATEAKIKATFGEDLRSDQHAQGEFVYAKGGAAISKYLEHAIIELDFADPADHGELTERKLKAFFTDPAIKQVHFVGSWGGEEWGTSGSAHWNLIAELDGGNFVQLKTTGGWQ